MSFIHYWPFPPGKASATPRRAALHHKYTPKTNTAVVQVSDILQWLKLETSGDEIFKTSRLASSESPVTDPVNYSSRDLGTKPPWLNQTLKIEPGIPTAAVITFKYANKFQTRIPSLHPRQLRSRIQGVRSEKRQMAES